MSQTVFKKIKKENGYAQISNEIINNGKLSYKAKGILIYILSKPDDWEVYISDLMTEMDREKSVRSGINELIDHRYMQRYRVYDAETKQVHHWETLTSEDPFKEEELIANVYETYHKDNEGNYLTTTIKFGSKKKKVSIVKERVVELLSQNGKVGIKKTKKSKKDLLSQKVKVGLLKEDNEGLQILIETNKEKTNKETSNTSSKGDKSPLAELFEDGICELKKTTVVKFKYYEKNYDEDFIRAIIEYGTEVGAKSYKWFETTVENYIARHIITGVEVRDSISKFHDENKKAKNRALEQKYEKRSLSESRHNEEMVKLNAIDDMAKEKEVNIKLEELMDITSELKECLVDNIGENQYKAFFEAISFLLGDGVVVVKCPNEFTKNIIDRRYLDIITKELINQQMMVNVVLKV